jgi:hypothetical protein
MSTITVTNIKATGETASRSATGIAGAFGDCDASGAITTTGSFNVSSVTDNGTSGKQFNYTNNFANPALGGAGQANGVGSFSHSSGAFIYCNSNTASHYSVQYYNALAYADTTAQFLALGELA